MVSIVSAERLFMISSPASSWLMLSLIWLLALARGERLSSTCLTAARRSSEAPRLGEAIEEVIGVRLLSFWPPGIRVREAERLLDSARET